MLPSRVSNTKVSRCLLARFNVGIIEGIGSTISQARVMNTSALPTTAMPEISQSGPGPWHGMPTAPPKQPPSFLLGGHGGATQRLLLIFLIELLNSTDTNLESEIGNLNFMRKSIRIQYY